MESTGKVGCVMKTGDNGFTRDVYIKYGRSGEGRDDCIQSAVSGEDGKRGGANVYVLVQWGGVSSRSTRHN